MAKKLKGKGKPFVKGVNILDSDPTAYKYVKKKYKMRQEGGTLNLASGLANTAFGMYAAFQHDKAIKQFINANKAKAKAEESEARADAYNKALETVQIQNQALKQEGINSSDISTKYLAQKIADGGNYGRLRNQYDDLNTQLQLQSDSNMANSIAQFGTQLFDFIKNSKKAPQNLGDNTEQQKASV